MIDDLTEAEGLKALSPGFALRAERPEDRAVVDALIERAFGPGRFAKVSQRLREGNHPLEAFGRVVLRGGVVLGAVRIWPIRIGDRSALFLGPIAVEASERGEGLGAALVRASLQAMTEDKNLDAEVVLLVGDLSFFGPLGFSQVPLGRVTLPGPVDGRRVLWTALREGAFERLSGPARLP